MMMMSQNRITAVSPTLTKQQFGRTKIKEELRKRGFYPPFWGWTVHTLKNISVNRYDQVLKLLDMVQSHIKSKYQVTQLIPLTLPWRQALQPLHLDRLIKDKKAVAEVCGRCIDSKRGLEVNLDLLPWIYDSYVKYGPNDAT